MLSAILALYGFVALEYILSISLGNWPLDIFKNVTEFYRPSSFWVDEKFSLLFINVVWAYHLITSEMNRSLNIVGFTKHDAKL